MGIDILYGNVYRSKNIAIPVKTTEWTMRTSGRGTAKVPFELPFPLGYKSAKIDNPNLLFAFVDLRGIRDDSTPDVYLVPASFVADYCSHCVEHENMIRFHVPIARLEPFKNNWQVIQTWLRISDP